jgi:hypothetical protein
MPVPEAAVDKNYLAPTHKYKIGVTRKIAPMQPITVASGVKKPSHVHFRASILAFDRLHRLASDGRRFHISLNPLDRDQFGFLDNHAGTPNGCFPHPIWSFVRDLEINVVDFLWFATEAIVERLEQPHLVKGLSNWVRIVPRACYRGR